jgi:phosphatidylglycerol:prolipoprotein diacylglycerol transferase
MLIGIALGRFACFHVGCCWGDVAVHDPWLANLAATSVGLQVQTLPWLAGDWVLTAVQYGPGTWPYEQQLALGLISPGAELSLPVHPVQLYEAALIALAVLVLGRAPAGGAGPGWLAAATVTAYAVITFVLEYLRADGVLVLGNLTITQLQSFVVTAAATAAAWHAGRHRPVHA